MERREGHHRRIRLVAAGLLAAAMSAVPGCRDETPAPPAAPVTEPAELTLGLNNGLRKIYLHASGLAGPSPRCDLRFRDIKADNLMDEVFVHIVRPENLTYRGRRDVRADGNDWTEYEWTSAQGLAFRLCQPVRAIGDGHLARLAEARFDVSAERLPFALLLIVQPSGAAAPYPLRDLSGHGDPRRALMLDEVAIEEGARRGETALFLLRKLDRGSRRQQVEALRQLERFTNQEILSGQPIILAARESEHDDVARAARRFCADRGLFSQQDLMRAVADLGSDDRGVVRRSLGLIKEMGRPAERWAAPAVRGLLDGGGLDPETASLARAALRALSGE